MQILAHRGHWLTPVEKNSATAFERAWAGGYGLETDLRDCDGTIVVSHDLPDRSTLGFETFLQAYAARGKDTMLALNIKADGQQAAIAALLAKYKAQNYFVFDMSVPDSLGYLRSGMPAYLRLSEYELWTVLHEKAAGIWLDAFEGTWWDLDLVRSLHAQGKAVAIVSPELHKRPHEALWRELRVLEIGIRDALLLCTDFPDAARDYFA